MPYRNTLLSLLFLTLPQISLANSECHKAPGALVLAHGSHKHGAHHITAPEHDHWNETVISAVKEAKKSVTFPMALAFGMWDKDAFQKGVNELASQGVCELRIIPLFISSDSEMIDIQKYMFGINEKLSFPIKVEKIHLPAQIEIVKFGKALDDHEAVGEILFERLTDISLNSNTEAVLFLTHGPYGDFYEPRWINLMKHHGQRVKQRLDESQNINFYDFSFFTLRDDSPAPIRDERTRLLREKVIELNQKNITPIIMPILLAAGGIEEGISKRLDGLSYKIQNKFLMPHQRIVAWISSSAQNQ